MWFYFYFFGLLCSFTFSTRCPTCSVIGAFTVTLFPSCLIYSDARWGGQAQLTNLPPPRSKWIYKWKSPKKQNTRSSLLTGTSLAPTSRTWLLVSVPVTLRFTLMPYESCNVVLPSLWLFCFCFLTPHHIRSKPVSTVKWPHHTGYQHLQTRTQPEPVCKLTRLFWSLETLNWNHCENQLQTHSDQFSLPACNKPFSAYSQPTLFYDAPKHFRFWLSRFSTKPDRTHSNSFQNQFRCGLNQFKACSHQLKWALSNT